MDVLIDGNPTRSTVERNAILNATPKASVAIQYNDLLNMKKDERRELVAGKDVNLHLSQLHRRHRRQNPNGVQSL